MLGGHFPPLPAEDPERRSVQVDEEEERHVAAAPCLATLPDLKASHWSLVTSHWLLVCGFVHECISRPLPEAQYTIRTSTAAAAASSSSRLEQQ